MNEALATAVLALLEQVLAIGKGTAAGTFTADDALAKVNAATATLASIEAADDAALRARFPTQP